MMDILRIILGSLRRRQRVDVAVYYRWDEVQKRLVPLE